MAEVRKKVIEDKYNTSSIKQNKKTEEIKDKREKKSKKDKKTTDKKEKKSLFSKFMIFCHGVKSEFKKVHWPKKDDMVKYSIATVLFIIFCSLFFYLIDVLFALIQTWLG